MPSVLTDGKTPFEVTPPWPGAQLDRPAARLRALADPAGPPADGPRDGQPRLEAPLRRRPRADARQLRQGRARRRRIPSCSTGWPASSSAGAGASRRAPADDDIGRRIGSRPSVSAAAQRLDPDNALYSRMPLLRLEAEVLYDAHASGRRPARRDPVRAARRGHGPAGRAGHARRAARGAGGAASTCGRSASRCRRSSKCSTCPQMNPNCLERRDSNVAPQALHLLNDGMVRTLAEQFAHRVSARRGRRPGPASGPGFTGSPSVDRPTRRSETSRSRRSPA